MRVMIQLYLVLSVGIACFVAACQDGKSINPTRSCLQSAEVGDSCSSSIETGSGAIYVVHRIHALQDYVFEGYIEVFNETPDTVYGLYFRIRPSDSASWMTNRPMMAIPPTDSILMHWAIPDDGYPIVEVAFQ